MPKATPATPSTPTSNNKSLGISVPDSQTLSSDAKNSKKFTVSIFFLFDLCHRISSKDASIKKTKNKKNNKKYVSQDT